MKEVIVVKHRAHMAILGVDVSDRLLRDPEILVWFPERGTNHLLGRSFERVTILGNPWEASKREEEMHQRAFLRARLRDGRPPLWIEI